MSDLTSNFPGYDGFLRDLKQRIQTAQIKAALAVNRELVLLYWSIGRDVLTRQAEQGWGAKVIQRLSADLRREFPEMKGFSPRNLVYMQTLAGAYSEEFTQQAVARIPWGHNCVILDKIAEPKAREWYIRAAVEHGWSRNVLAHQIETKLYERQGKAITNFQRRNVFARGRRAVGASSNTDKTNTGGMNSSARGLRPRVLRTQRSNDYQVGSKMGFHSGLRPVEAQILPEWYLLRLASEGRAAEGP